VHVLFREIPDFAKHFIKQPVRSFTEACSTSTVPVYY
jgi:hypothetical protein